MNTPGSCKYPYTWAGFWPGVIPRTRRQRPGGSAPSQDTPGKIRDEEPGAEHPDAEKVLRHKREWLVGELGVPDIAQRVVRQEQPDRRDKRLGDHREPEAEGGKDIAEDEQDNARQARGEEVDHRTAVEHVLQLRDEHHPGEKRDGRDCQVLPAHPSFTRRYPRGIPVLLHPGREGPEAGVLILEPVQGPPGDDDTVLPVVEDPGTGLGDSSIRIHALLPGANLPHASPGLFRVHEGTGLELTLAPVRKKIATSDRRDARAHDRDQVGKPPQKPRATWVYFLFRRVRQIDEIVESSRVRTTLVKVDPVTNPPPPRS